MRQRKEQLLTRDNVTESVHIVSLYFCTRYPPRYGDRVERTQDKKPTWRVGRHVKGLAVCSTDSKNRDVEKR